MFEKMVKYYKLAFQKYAVFEGRSGRAEYWYFFLANLLITIVFSILEAYVSRIFGDLGSIYSLVLLVPSLAFAARRLHDIGRSGWWLLIVFFPLVGWIWCIVLLAMKSQPADNQYGPYTAVAAATTPPTPPTTPTPSI